MSDEYAYSILEAYTDDELAMIQLVKALDEAGYEEVGSNVVNGGLRAIALYNDGQYQLLYRENFTDFLKFNNSEVCNVSSFLEQAEYTLMRQRLTTKCRHDTLVARTLDQLDLFKP